MINNKDKGYSKYKNQKRNKYFQTIKIDFNNNLT